MIVQRRFIAIGGRATRPGGGTTHSRTSIKQVGSIPTAPGSPGRARDKSLSALYVPLSRVTQPQLRLRSPSGRWEHIDTSFADLQGISDLVITAADNEGSALAKRPEDLAEDLIALCQSYFNENSIAKFSTNDLVMNSGPEQDSITNYTLKRRQWFAIVRAFYNGRDTLWSLSDVHTVPLDLLYRLVSSLDAASDSRKHTPRLWEDEPVESYAALPLKPLVDLLACAMRAQGRGLLDCAPDMLVGCVGLGGRYAVAFRDAGLTPGDDLRWALLNVSNTQVSCDHALSLVFLLCQVGDDISVQISQAAKLMSLRDGEDEKAHCQAIGALFERLGSKGNAPFEQCATADLAALIALAAGVRSANPTFFEKSTQISRCFAQVLGVVKIAIRGRRALGESDDYSPVRDFGRHLRLSHPAIQPHMRLRTLLGVRTQDASDKRSVAVLLDAYKGYLGVVDAPSRASPVAQMLLEGGVQRSRAEGSVVSPSAAMATLEAAIERYGASASHYRVSDLFVGLDNAHVVGRMEMADCVRFLSICARCGYYPGAARQLVARVLKLGAPPSVLASVATSLSAVGETSVGVFHSLSTAFLQGISADSLAGDARNVCLVDFLFAAMQSLQPRDAMHLIDRVTALAPLPVASAVVPQTALQCAQICAVRAAVAGTSPEDAVIDVICNYLITSLPSDGVPAMTVVAALSCCASLGIVCPDSLSKHLGSVQLSDLGIDGNLGVLSIATVLVTIPTGVQSLEGLGRTMESQLVESLGAKQDAPLASALLVDAVHAALTVFTVVQSRRAAQQDDGFAPPSLDSIMRFIVKLLYRVDGAEDVSSLNGDGIVNALAKASGLLEALGLSEKADDYFQQLVGYGLN